MPPQTLYIKTQSTVLSIVPIYVSPSDENTYNFQYYITLHSVKQGQLIDTLLSETNVCPHYNCQFFSVKLYFY